MPVTAVQVVPEAAARVVPAAAPPVVAVAVDLAVQLAPAVAPQAAPAAPAVVDLLSGRSFRWVNRRRGPAGLHIRVTTSCSASAFWHWRVRLARSSRTSAGADCLPAADLQGTTELVGNS